MSMGPVVRYADDCSTVADLMPGTSSKCKISSLTVPITVVTPTGSVQLVKDIVPNSDTGKFNLSVTPSGGTAATATDVGDGGSVTKSSITADTVVTLAETAGTGTSLANYTSSLACVNSANQAPVTVTSNQITMPTRRSASSAPTRTRANRRRCS
jgi:hypothetical protein